MSGAAVGSAIGAAVGEIGGAIIGGKYAKDIANEAKDTQKAAMGFTKDVWKQGREDLAPWRTTGGNALAAYWDKVQAGPGEFEESPGYQFRLAEGEKALERSAAARGRTFSGGQLKALSDYNQGSASSEYQNFLSQYYQSLTPYESISNMGLSAATTTAGLGGQAATNVGNMSNAMAGTYNNMANSQQQMWGNVGNSVSNAFGNMYAHSMYNNQQPNATYSSSGNSATATFN